MADTTVPAWVQDVRAWGNLAQLPGGIGQQILAFDPNVTPWAPTWTYGGFNIIPSVNWDREVSPKIVLRFNNPRTGGGTSDSGAFVKYDLLIREIRNLNGVTNGFIEITNYRGQAIEILSPREGEFWLIRDRMEETKEAFGQDVLAQRIRLFLTK